MVATPGSDELHIPPATLSVSVVEFVWQISSEPKITPAYGDGLMVTTAVAYTVVQLLVTPYDIVVVPAEWPVTKPKASTLASVGARLLHTPPGVASVSAVIFAGHTLNVPVINPAVGSGLTVTTAVVATVPQLLDTV